MPDNPNEPFLPWDPTELLPDIEKPAAEREITFIVVAPDGTMTIYDESGELKPEDCDKAYSLWVSENGIMDKKLDNYSVTEGLLALVLLFTAVNFVRGLFRRKDIYR